jgi:uncharacterized protein YwgA
MFLLCSRGHKSKEGAVHSEDFVLAIIAALPDRKIKGKKRLQKLAFFLKSAGVRCDAHFGIRDYGPFSREIAAAAQLLVLKGRVGEREEPIGASGTFVTVYKIQGDLENAIRPLPEKYRQLLRRLESFPTVDLEVAATLQFFRSAGFASETARKKTIELKPVKATAQVMRSVPKILDFLHAT